MCAAKRGESNLIPLLLERLAEEYPDATYELNWETPLELLVAVILAAQCTDERVNQVTISLFRKYTSAAAYAEAELSQLEEDVRPTGFYKKKARRLQDVCRILVERFGGEVPPSMDDLTSLPGVARKTANVVLNIAMGQASGIIVDTHVERVARRLGLSAQKNTDRIEQDLMQMTPQEKWTFFGPALVLHGRYVCVAKSPRCGKCVLEDVCPKIDVSSSS